MNRSLQGNIPVTMWARGCVWVFFCAGLAGCVHPGPKGGPSAAVVPRIIDGRVEPTAATAAAVYTNEAGRTALIEQAREHRVSLLRESPPPSALCSRARGRIRVDGKLDEPAWRAAPPITGFRLTRKCESAQMQTEVKLLWDKRALYVGFACEDSDVLASITDRDGELWREDAAEVFIDANGDGMSYIEIEISPRNVVYDASVADYRAEINWVTDLAHLDIARSIILLDAPAIRSGAVVDGTANMSTDKDNGWSCEIAIPWRDIARGTNVRHVPPRAGDTWRIGLFRVNVNSDKERHPDEYTAWHPTTSWFHVPWLFGNVEFAE